MQRFRIAGLYLVGVVAIIALAVWGVSSRRTVARADMPAHAPPTPEVAHASPSGRTDSARTPSTGPAEIGGVAKVSIEAFRFVPEELTIAAGTTVTWVNTDDVPHTATSSSKPSAFDSKTLDTDDKYSFQFKTAGTYEYYCKVHPHMTAKIIVK